MKAIGLFFLLAGVLLLLLPNYRQIIPFSVPVDGNAPSYGSTAVVIGAILLAIGIFR